MKKFAILELVAEVIGFIIMAKYSVLFFLYLFDNINL